MTRLRKRKGVATPGIEFDRESLRTADFHSAATGESLRAFLLLLGNYKLLATRFQGVPLCGRLKTLHML
jgi:hypothetical protein